jgi:hypothetical protein
LILGFFNPGESLRFTCFPAVWLSLQIPWVLKRSWFHCEAQNWRWATPGRSFFGMVTFFWFFVRLLVLLDEVVLRVRVWVVFLDLTVPLAFTWLLVVVFLTLVVLDPAAEEETARLGLDFLLEVGGCDRLPEGDFEDLDELFRGRDEFLAACLGLGAKRHVQVASKTKSPPKTN